MLLLFAICFARPAETYAYSEYKYMDVKCDLTKQKSNLFTGTFTWNKLSGCPYYKFCRLNEDGSEEELFTVDDENCKCVVKDLEYGRIYHYVIYVYRDYDGELLTDFHYDFNCYMEVSGVFRYMKSADQVKTSKKKISIELSSARNLIQPEYIEVTRDNKLTSSTKKFKIKWDDIKKTEAGDSPLIKYNFIFTDDTMKPGEIYEYTFRPYIVLKGKKIYAQGQYTYTLAAYNRIPSCDVKVTHNKKDNTFLVRLKNKKGDAPLMINSNFITKKQAVANPMKLTEISYDGKNYIEARKGLYFFLQEDETIYMKFKGNDITETSFQLFFKYFYNRRDEADACNMTLEINKKSYKNEKLIPDGVTEVAW